MTSATHTDEALVKAMNEALRLAETAAAEGDVPIGAVVLDPSGAVIGRGYNRRESDHDPTAHAEVLALREAAAALGTWHLDDCTIVVTLEPCVMCAGALVASRMHTVVYGCRDPKGGAVTTLYAVTEDPRLNHRVRVREGVLADECAALLAVFFERLRAAKSTRSKWRAGREAEGA